MRPAPDVVVLENAHWRVGIVPETGASVAFGQVKVDGEWRDVLRPTPPESLHDHADCASYVLAPWSNRIRDGRLRVGADEWRLRINMADGTAIHGAANEFPWMVVEQTVTRVVLAFDSAGFVGVNFPWRFKTEMTYELVGESFEWRTEVTNADDVAFPAGFGHHPYFQRGVVDPNVVEAELRIPCDLGYDLTDCMPAAAAGDPRPAADFRIRRPLGEAFVDDCLTGRRFGEQIRIAWPSSGVTVEMVADELYSHVVVYIPQDKSFFAVEPVTNANDGFNLAAAGVPGTGVFVLEPGESRAAEFALVADVRA